MSWVIYDFSHMFICLLWFCHGLPNGEIVRTYVIHLLGTYVTHWLILWQNALYLYLGKSRMCLILQETCCSSLILKPWKLDQETSEEKLFTKAGQIAWQLLDSCSIDSLTATRQVAIYRGLMKLNIYYLSRYLIGHKLNDPLW